MHIALKRFGHLESSIALSKLKGLFRVFEESKSLHINIQGLWILDDSGILGVFVCWTSRIALEGKLEVTVLPGPSMYGIVIYIRYGWVG